MLESQINFLGMSELKHSNGIDILIDKLNEIKDNPCPKQLAAIETFAYKLATINTSPIIKMKANSGSWIIRRQINGKIFQKISHDPKIVLNAYNEFLNEVEQYENAS